MKIVIRTRSLSRIDKSLQRRQTNATAGRDDNRIGETGNQGYISVICHYRRHFDLYSSHFSYIYARKLSKPLMQNVQSKQKMMELIEMHGL